MTSCSGACSRRRTDNRTAWSLPRRSPPCGGATRRATTGRVAKCSKRLVDISRITLPSKQAKAEGSHGDRAQALCDQGGRTDTYLDTRIKRELLARHTVLAHARVAESLKPPLLTSVRESRLGRCMEIGQSRRPCLQDVNPAIGKRRPRQRAESIRTPLTQANHHVAGRRFDRRDGVCDAGMGQGRCSVHVIKITPILQPGIATVAWWQGGSDRFQERLASCIQVQRPALVLVPS